MQTQQTALNLTAFDHISYYAAYNINNKKGRSCLQFTAEDKSASALTCPVENIILDMIYMQLQPFIYVHVGLRSGIRFGNESMAASPAGITALSSPTVRCNEAGLWRLEAQSAGCSSFTRV